ncbi:MAG: hypothetical protein ACJ77D_10295 [Chloroflexota bacterium]|jgi:hypothetical protein
MNERSDMDRVLRHWFADGPSEMPDRVVDTVADRIGRQRQRRPWRLPWRPIDMNSAIKIGAALAAVLVLAVAGWNLLPGGSTGVGGGPSPSPSPSPTASPTHSPSPTPRSAGMVVQQKTISWTAKLPANWGNEGWFVTPSQGPGGPTGIAVAAPGAVYVPSDPCDGVGKEPDAKTPADVVAALRSRTDLVVSNVIDATLDGHTGKRVDIQAPADLSACADLYIIMAEPSGAGFHVQGPSQKIRMWIVDVDGQPMVFQINSFAATPPDDMAAAQRIVDSIAITP